MLAFCAALFYLLPGVLGHEPWKQDETYTFGMIDHLLKTGEWLIPTNAGQPFMEKPPLYIWVAGALAWLFSPILPLHDGARLASALFAALAFLFAARSAQAAFAADAPGDRARSHVIATLVLMAGTLLVVKHVHDMFSDVALFAGASVAFCGLLRIVVSLHDAARRTSVAARASASASPSAASSDGIGSPRPPAGRTFMSRDAITFGIGTGIALMSKGIFVPGVFAATTIVLPLLSPYCRSRAYAKAIALSIAASLPFLLIWPVWLYLVSPTDFMTWFWDNNIGRFLGFSVAELGSDNERGFILKAILTSGFPVWPLAIAGLVLGGWRRLRPAHPGLLVPFVVTSIGLAVLSASATARQLYLLPFVLPAALLAVDGLDRLPRWCASAWDWSSRLLFGAMAGLVWAIWFVMRQPVEVRALQHSWLNPGQTALGRWLPLDYQLPFAPFALLVAALMTIAWIRLLPMLAAQSRRRGAMSWCAGLTLVWGLVFTLLLPWLDRGKSYGPVFRDLSMHIEKTWQAGDCMASRRLGESEAPMLAYFSGITHRPLEVDAAADQCRWLIVQGKSTAKQVSDIQWQPYWQGARQGDTNELLSVYRRRSTMQTIPTPPVEPAATMTSPASK